jgi:Fic family protein
MALYQDENLSNRYYSPSSQIMARRKAYYEILENTNKGQVSKATTQRDLAGLVQNNILQSNPGGGRSSSYDLCWDKFTGNVA